MTKDEALKLALETAEGIFNSDWRKWEELASPEEFERWVKSRALHMATAIRKALAQPEQEPVAIKRMKEWIEYLKRKSDFGQHMKIPSEMSASTCWELALELEQFINTTPPQRKPLTDEEIAKAWAQSKGDILMRLKPFARAIEAAHGIKGE